MTLKDKATRVAALDTLRKRVADELAAARTDLHTALAAASEETGTRQIVFGLDGTDIGKATYVEPEDTAVIIDEQALIAWVRTMAPTEITSRIVTEIRPAWLNLLLKQITTSKQTVWVDEQGEIHDVPGIELQPKAAHTRITVPQAGKDALAEAWRTRAVWRLALPELTGGDDQ